MIVKILRGVWFISMLAVVANLLYVYAGLPEEVVVFEEGADINTVGRETMFYSWFTIVGAVNVLVYIFSKSLVPDEGFRTWFTGLIITLNFFLIIALSFISLHNSNESFDFSRTGVVLYIALGLVVAWLISWPIVLLIRKFSA
jgi:hypothetical protein